MLIVDAAEGLVVGVLAHNIYIEKGVSNVDAEAWVLDTHWQG